MLCSYMKAQGLYPTSIRAIHLNHGGPIKVLSIRLISDAHQTRLTILVENLASEDPVPGYKQVPISDDATSSLQRFAPTSQDACSSKMDQREWVRLRKK